MKVGYARVSTLDQNEARQVEALEKCGVERIFIEKKSGKNTDRPRLNEMLEFVREGDEVYVTEFSRLSRSIRDMWKIVDTLERKKVKLVSLKENLDTHTPQGRLMLTFVAALAEFEREILLERQREGIEIAKRNGRYKGRSPKDIDDFEELYEKWKKGEVTVTKAAKKLGICRATFYNHAKRMMKLETIKKDLKE